MGFFRIKLFVLGLTLLASLQLFSASELITRNHPLYLMQNGKISESLDLYLKYCSEQKHMDLALLQDLARIILEQGAQSKDDQILLLTMYGAGQALSSQSIEILAKGIASHNPEIQMTALHFLSQLQDDSADHFLLKAMASPFLPIRLEALYFLTERKHISALGQTESLMNRLPSEIKPLFVQLFAKLDTKDALSYWKNFFFDPSPQVRLEAILETAKHKRDDLLPIIRQKCQHPNAPEQEAAAFTLGILHDSSSIKLLMSLKDSPSENLSLSAHIALYRLGKMEASLGIEKLARQNNLFAIAALGDLENISELLPYLLKSDDENVRLNAGLALLEKKDPRSLPILRKLFLSDEEYLIRPIFSHGHSQRAWHVAKASLQDERIFFQIKEHLFKKIADLPEEVSISFLKEVFEHYRRDLIPSSIAILENLNSEKSKELLKTFAKKEECPLVRDYCRLALYRLQENSPNYENEIKTWLLFASKHRLIQLKPYIPWQNRQDTKNYTLTLEETSHLLIDSYLALASRRDEEALKTIVQSLKNGSKHNRSVLAGLILRATE